MKPSLNRRLIAPEISPRIATPKSNHVPRPAGAAILAFPGDPETQLSTRPQVGAAMVSTSDVLLILVIPRPHIGHTPSS
uniref:Uncharacterized protein n=1 Tax=Pseudomonas putida TaxID=303 RepID=Q8VMH7_PSEPU|nr:hypothetical protein [Pseudomonas putida]